MRHLMQMLEFRCRYSVNVFQTPETAHNSNDNAKNSRNSVGSGNGNETDQKLKEEGTPEDEQKPEAILPEPMDTTTNSSSPSETSENLNNENSSNNSNAPVIEENSQNSGLPSTSGPEDSSSSSETKAAESRVQVVMGESRDWPRVGKPLFQICITDRNGAVLNNSKPICCAKDDLDKNLPLRSGETIAMEWINFVGINERLLVENKPSNFGLNLVK